MRTHKREFQLAALAVAGVMLASGCGGGDDDTGASGDLNLPPVDGGEISVYWCKPERPLLPADTAETCGGNLLDQITAKLVRYNSETAEVEMDLAQSIKTEDNRTYTVKLKKGQKFHDGTEVTADSFVDAWNFAAYAPNAQQNTSFFSAIDGYADVAPEDPDGDGPEEAPEPKSETLKGLKVVDPTTFTIKLSNLNSTFPQRLGYTAFAPLPESFFADKGASFGTKPIGAGPFKLISYNPDREAVLERDENYNRAGKPKIGRAIFKVFTSEDAGYAEVQANQLDITNIVPSSKRIDEIYKNDLTNRFVTAPEGVFQSITFPPSKTDDTYDNPKLRQAISMAINRENVIKVAFPEREAATGWVSPVAAGYKAGACGQFCEFDPTKAKQLFDDAGGYKGTMTLAFNGGGGGHDVWTEAVCNEIKTNLGVECIAQASVDFASFRAKIEAKEQKGMFRTGWQMDYPSIENFLEPIFKTNASSNDGNYSNKAFDAMLVEAAGETDESQVFKKYQQAEAMLAKDMPSIPLWYSTAIFGHSNKVANVKITPFGTYDLSAVTVLA